MGEASGSVARVGTRGGLALHNEEGAVVVVVYLAGYNVVI